MIVVFASCRVSVIAKLMLLVFSMIIATFLVKSNGFAGRLDMKAFIRNDAAECVRFQRFISKSAYGCVLGSVFRSKHRGGTSCLMLSVLRLIRRIVRRRADGFDDPV